AGPVDLLQDHGTLANPQPGAAVRFRDEAAKVARFSQRAHERVGIGAIAVDPPPVFAGILAAQGPHGFADVLERGLHHGVTMFSAASRSHVARYSAKLRRTTRSKVGASSRGQTVAAAFPTCVWAHWPTWNARRCRSIGQPWASTSRARGPRTLMTVWPLLTSVTAAGTPLRASASDRTTAACSTGGVTSSHSSGPSQRAAPTRPSATVLGLAGSLKPISR